jgi:glycosyltransferase involved in cell wall biosynthesis
MLEAMACGLPVVAPAVGDLADVVRNGETGYLIDEDDQAAFVAAIHHLLDNDATRGRLGDNARSTILRGYTVEDGARAWHAALQRFAVPRQAPRWRPATASPTRDASKGDR